MPGKKGAIVGGAAVTGVAAVGLDQARKATSGSGATGGAPGGSSGGGGGSTEMSRSIADAGPFDEIFAFVGSHPELVAIGIAAVVVVAYALGQE